MEAAAGVIRALGQEDAAEAVRVIHAAFAAQGVVTDPPSGALRETAASVGDAIAAGGGFGAEAGAGLVGVVLWVEQPGALYLGRLAVVPAARGRSVGRGLVDAVEALARRRGLAKVTLGARLVLTSNRAFFAACGYREAGFETHAGYAAPTSVRMERML